MLEGTCRRCGDTRIRYASTIARHLLRAALRSRKRYCQACGFKWSEGTASFAAEFFEANILLLAVASVVLYLSVQIYRGAWKPLDDLKTMVRLPDRVSRRLRRR